MAKNDTSAAPTPDEVWSWVEQDCLPSEVAGTRGAYDRMLEKVWDQGYLAADNGRSEDTNPYTKPAAP